MSIPPALYARRPPGFRVSKPYPSVANSTGPPLAIPNFGDKSRLLSAVFSLLRWPQPVVLVGVAAVAGRLHASLHVTTRRPAAPAGLPSSHGAPSKLSQSGERSPCAGFHELDDIMFPHFQWYQEASAELVTAEKASAGGEEGAANRLAAAK
jgi:hypothetical protein